MRGFTLTSVIVLVIVVVVVAIASVLLARTVQTAQAINTKAQNIAKNGRGINKSTDSVIQLTRTNDLARSILTSAKPLQGQLAGIVGTANRINGLAGSINNSALRINSTANSINSSATNINSAASSINGSAGSILNSAGTINNSAASISNSAGSINNSALNINTGARSIRRSAGTILVTARAVDNDVRLINLNLDTSNQLVAAVKGDTGNILLQAFGAHDTAACIDRKLFGSTGTDGDCTGNPKGGVRSRSRSADNSARAASTGAPAPNAPVPGIAPSDTATPQTSTPDAANPSRPTDPLSEVLSGLGLGGNPAAQGSRQSPQAGVDTLLKQLVPGAK